MGEMAQLARSVASAVKSGTVWSSHFFRGDMAPDSERYSSDRVQKNAATAARAVRQIPADVLRSILVCSEEDERRDECEIDWEREGAPKGARGANENCGSKYGVTISRVGVKIERASIIGYLDLSGIHFKRPLVFSECRFTHSVNISNARLGPISFTDCDFDPAPENYEEAIKRYPTLHDETNTSAKIGHLPPRMMVAQGINAQGAMFDGYVDLTRLHAQRLEFQDARFENNVDLEKAEIRHPDVCHKRIIEEGEKWDDAVDFSSARGQLLLVNAATIIGCVNLTEARFAGIYFTESHLRALVQPHGSRGLAVTGRALDVKSDLWFRCGASPRVEQMDKSQADIIGGMSFESANIGGEVRFEGVSVELGLSDSHRRIFAEHEKETGLSRSERQAMRAISFRNCTVGGSIKITKYEPKLEELIPTDTLRVEHSHGQDRPFRCDGEIHLRGATVESDVWLEGCRVENRALARTLDLRDIRIEGTLNFKRFTKNSKGIIDLRGATAKIYRDDFEYLRGPTILGGINPFLHLNEFKHLVLSSMALMAELALFVITLGLHGREHLWSQIVRRERRPSPAQGWPRQLLFRLGGFEYGTFPIREDPSSTANSDSSRMPLTREARLRWLKHQEPIWLTSKFQPQPWIHCAKVLRELGYDRQAHILLIRREKLAMGSADVGVGEKLVRWFLVLVCGHGHAMWRLIPIGAVTFTCALAINTVAIRSNLMRPTNSIVLVSDAYKLRGEVPTNYSALNPLSFTLQSMFPLPPIGGGSEWRACNWSQIRLAIRQRSPAACVPRVCPISDQRDCKKLPVLLESTSTQPAPDLRDRYLHVGCRFRSDEDVVDLRRDDERGRVISNVICASPNAIRLSIDAPIAKRLEKFVDPVAKYYATVVNVGVAILNEWTSITGIHFDTVTIRPFILRDSLNIAIAGGLAARFNAFAAFVGWGIVLLVGTYTVGTLKRRE